MAKRKTVVYKVENCNILYVICVVVVVVVLFCFVFFVCSLVCLFVCLSFFWGGESCFTIEI